MRRSQTSSRVAGERRCDAPDAAGECARSRRGHACFGRRGDPGTSRERRPLRPPSERARVTIARRAAGAHAKRHQLTNPAPGSARHGDACRSSLRTPPCRRGRDRSALLSATRAWHGRSADDVLARRDQALSFHEPDMLPRVLGKFRQAERRAHHRAGAVRTDEPDRVDRSQAFHTVQGSGRAAAGHLVPCRGPGCRDDDAQHSRSRKCSTRRCSRMPRTAKRCVRSRAIRCACSFPASKATRA